MNDGTFFGIHIYRYSLLGQTALLLVATVLGAAIGAQREWRGNPAGLRTHVLVCVGAALITIISVQIGFGLPPGYRGDPGHIAAQIVSGIGFLGAGAIMRESATVRGLTTAASIWTVGGIGIAVGAGPHLAQVAVIAAVIVFSTLSVFNKLEVSLRLKGASGVLTADIRIGHGEVTRFLDLLREHSIQVLSMEWEAPVASADSSGDSHKTRHVQMRIQFPRVFNRDDFNSALAEEHGIASFRLE